MLILFGWKVMKSTNLTLNYELFVTWTSLVVHFSEKIKNKK